MPVSLNFSEGFECGVIWYIWLRACIQQLHTLIKAVKIVLQDVMEAGSNKKGLTD